MSAQSAEKLIWLDLELTGLDPDIHAIIEIATIATDLDLNVIEEGPSLVIHQSDEVLSRMNEWSVDHHTRSGLVDRVRKSEVVIEEAEARTLEFVRRHVDYKKAPLCGNSIWNDRRFMVHQMPTLDDFFHYRIIDVSSVKELARRWHPAVFSKVKKDVSHIALSDIYESIRELRLYRDHFLISN